MDKSRIITHAKVTDSGNGNIIPTIVFSDLPLSELDDAARAKIIEVDPEAEQKLLVIEAEGSAAFEERMERASTALAVLVVKQLVAEQRDSPDAVLMLSGVCQREGHVHDGTSDWSQAAIRRPHVAKQPAHSLSDTEDTSVPIEQFNLFDGRIGTNAPSTRLAYQIAKGAFSDSGTWEKLSTDDAVRIISAIEIGIFAPYFMRKAARPLYDLMMSWYKVQGLSEHLDTLREIVRTSLMEDERLKFIFERVDQVELAKSVGSQMLSVLDELKRRSAKASKKVKGTKGSKEQSAG